MCILPVYLEGTGFFVFPPFDLYISFTYQKKKKVEGYGLKFIHSNWNSNSSSNIYYDLEMIFGVLSKVIFGHSIYRFKAQEVRNPTIQTVCKLELQQGRYG